MDDKKTKTAQFTPGPWVARLNRVDSEAQSQMGREMFAAIALSNSDANARLIAQAPAMYVLLKRFVAIADPMPLQATARLKEESIAVLDAVEGK